MLRPPTMRSSSLNHSSVELRSRVTNPGRLLSILLIGDASRREFAAAIEFTRSVAQVQHHHEASAAIEHLATAVESPELILLAQRWPGEFSGPELDSLQSAAPLARIVCLVGSWSEGEARSGRPWPGMVRVEAVAWPARLGQDLERLARGEAPSWSLPITARDEERVLAASQSPPERRTGLIVVVAEREATSSAIADACQLRGYATISLRLDDVATPSITGAIAAVWDTTSELASDTNCVERLRKSLGNIPLVALLDFPRVQHIAAAKAAGVAAILAKPYLIGDLYWQLDEVLG